MVIKFDINYITTNKTNYIFPIAIDNNNNCYLLLNMSTNKDIKPKLINFTILSEKEKHYISINCNTQEESAEKIKEVLQKHFSNIKVTRKIKKITEKTKSKTTETKKPNIQTLDHISVAQQSEHETISSTIETKKEKLSIFNMSNHILIKQKPQYEATNITITTETITENNTMTKEASEKLKNLLKDWDYLKAKKSIKITPEHATNQGSDQWTIDTTSTVYTKTKNTTQESNNPTQEHTTHKQHEQQTITTTTTIHQKTHYKKNINKHHGNTKENKKYIKITNNQPQVEYSNDTQSIPTTLSNAESININQPTESINAKTMTTYL